MKIFILDDQDVRHRAFVKRFIGHQLTHAYTASDAMRKLEDGPYDVAFFDHDLADWYKKQDEDGNEVLLERTGLDVVEHLLERIPPAKWPREVVVHSWNGTRGQLMTALLNKNGVSATYQPFTA